MLSCILTFLLQERKQDEEKYTQVKLGIIYMSLKYKVVHLSFSVSGF